MKEREFPNIYGRKPSAIIDRKTGEFVKGFDSRREAINFRRNNAGDPSKYAIVPNGAQKEDGRRTGTQDEQRHNRKGSQDRTRQGEAKANGKSSSNRAGNQKGSR